MAESKPNISPSSCAAGSGNASAGSSAWYVPAFAATCSKSLHVKWVNSQEFRKQAMRVLLIGGH